MKRTIACILIAIALAGNAAAQAWPTPLPTTGTPMFAMPLLTDYLVKKAQDTRTGGIVLSAIGGTVLALGSAAAIYAFVAPTSDFSSPEEHMLLRGLSIGAAGGGALMTFFGARALAKPRDGYQVEYAYIFAEEDPVVQEAMAYAVIKDLSEEARRSRIIGGVTNLATPLVILITNAAMGVMNDGWDSLGDHLLDSSAWTIGNLVTGIVMLTFGKSEEERLLEQYRTISGAYAGVRP